MLRLILYIFSYLLLNGVIRFVNVVNIVEIMRHLNPQRKRAHTGNDTMDRHVYGT